MKKIRIGIIGLGTVGGGAAKILRRKRSQLRKQEQLDLVLAGAADTNKDAFKGLGIPASACVSDWRELVKSDRIDVIAELIGGKTPARTVIREAIRAGKHVVTANKALLAEYGEELFDLAHKHQVILRFEAAVAGAIPILRSLREGLSANSIQSITGILNGTSNYILHAMKQKALNFSEALAQAQEKGYAEADPTLDIEGCDAAHKLCLLSSLAFHGWTPLNTIYTEGISAVGLQDITYASELGYVIKPLAIARKNKGAIEVHVHPALIPADDMLAGVPRQYNAVLVHSDHAGPTLYFGKGAGRFPTASSIVGDMVDIARDIASNSVNRLDPIPCFNEIPIKPMEEIVTRHYLRLNALDRPGVIGRLGSTLGEYGISIASVVQKEPVPGETRPARGSVPVVALLQPAKELMMQQALKKIKRLSCVKSTPVLLRIEERGE